MKHRYAGLGKWLATACLAASATAWGFGHWFEVISLGSAPYVDIGDGVMSVEWQHLALPSWPRHAMVVQMTGAWGFVPPSVSRRVECKPFCDGTTIWPGKPITYTTVIIPLWLPTAFSAMMCWVLWRAWINRPRPGHCVKCRYNLTGNTSGVCPECGDQIPLQPSDSFSLAS